jgi:cation transport regulator ChaC
MTGDTWYFAYGSNLSVDQKEFRTGRIRRAVRCRLPGYRFAFNKRAAHGGVYANIVADATQEVWGVIYLCNRAAMDEMDRREGVAGGHYERRVVQVIDDAGENVEAVTYLAGASFVCEDGKPSAEYLQKIVTGGRHHGLPEEYVRGIEKLGSRDEE